MGTRGWRLGDYKVVCDRTGRRVWASETKVEWNGWRVWKKAFWSRHPQDFVRGLRDDQYVENARPPGITQFTGPLTTELDGDHSAGDQTITVVSSARFDGGDRVLIGLDNNQMFASLVQSVPSATTITLTTKLTWAASSGNAVINTTAVSQSDI